MRRMLPTVLLAVGLLVGLLPPDAVAAALLEADLAREAMSGSPNLQHVANLPHATAPTATAPAKGSDIDFATLD